MKSLLTLAIISIFSICVSAQSFLPDSVVISIDTLVDNRSRIDFLNTYSKQIMRTNPAMAEQVLAYSLAETANDDFWAARVKINIAIYQMYFGDLDSAVTLLNEAKTAVELEGDSLVLIDVYSELGSVGYFQSNDSAAFQNWYSALELAQRLDQLKAQAFLYNNISLLYGYSQQYEKSIEFLKNSIRIKDQLGEIAATGKSYHNIAIQFLELGQRDSALVYFKKGREIRERFNDLKGLTSSYSSLGSLFFDEDQFDSAIHYFNKATTLGEELGDIRALAFDLQGLGESYFKKGMTTVAIPVTKQALEIAQENRVIERAYRVLALSYRQLGQYREATDYYQKYTALHDSLVNESRIRAVEEVEEKYNTRQKELEIDNLQQENQLIALEAQQARQQRLLFLLGFLLLVVVVVAILFVLRTRNQKNRELEQANTQLKSLNQTKDRLFSVISHDLKSPLSSFHLITKSITENYDKIDKGQIKDYLITLRDSSANVRDMMDNLLRWALAQTDQLSYNPSEVEAMSTVENVKRQLLPALELKKIQVKLPEDSRLQVLADQEFLEIVIRNLISNAIKFSKMSSEIEILAAENDEAKRISIRDYGVGMSQDQADRLFKGELMAHDIKNSSEKGTGIGLSLSMELMRKMGGTIEVQSEEQKGTTFTLVFPKAA
jgi:signal transduction histidine kinase